MKVFTIFACIFTVATATAQDQTALQKIGYADVDYILMQHPLTKQIESELKSLRVQLENQLKTKYQALRERLEYYQPREKGMSNDELENAKKELTLLQENLQKFEQSCQEALQRKQKQLMDPLSKNIQDAIRDVANENNYKFILNGSAGRTDILLHASDSEDVSNLVLKKLGVTPAVRN